MHAMSVAKRATYTFTNRCIRFLFCWKCIWKWAENFPVQAPDQSKARMSKLLKSTGNMALHETYIYSMTCDIHRNTLYTKCNVPGNGKCSSFRKYSHPFICCKFKCLRNWNIGFILDPCMLESVRVSLCMKGDPLEGHCSYLGMR